MPGMTFALAESGGFDPVTLGAQAFQLMGKAGTAIAENPVLAVLLAFALASAAIGLFGRSKRTVTR